MINRDERRGPDGNIEETADDPWEITVGGSGVPADSGADCVDTDKFFKDKSEQGQSGG